jgi:hypothetical protein
MSRFRFPHLTSGRWTACLGMAFVLALAGCTPIKVKLGMKVYLAKTPSPPLRSACLKARGSLRERSPRWWLW